MLQDVKQAKQRFGIIGNSPALDNAISRAIRVAPTDLSVLVIGESGAGKEVFPRIIHQSGARKHKKYIAVNCGAIPEGTIDSELFGHEKGSFTGAIADRKGYFEEADGGTIFLDEVAELPLTTQARLLRVLETGEFLKVGSSTVQKTNVRIVAATNVDLVEAVKQGRFREDLFYRLSTIRIDVPNLHDRHEDIILLARKFASDFSRRYLTSPISFSEEARRAMMVYRWPGNVRQLKNVVEQLALFHAGEEISREVLLETLPLDRSGSNTPAPTHHPHDYEREREILWQTILALRNDIADIKEQLRDAQHETQGHHFPKSHITSLIKYPEDSQDSRFEPAHEVEDVAMSSEEPYREHPRAHDPEQPLAQTVGAVEREAVAAALARNPGNKKAAADELSISTRTLYRKIKEFGIKA
ncbi:MAG: sigma-54 dependent transcriptional regulator [Muribaculaceae bacterium]|nr:sigma-54 dependent transcriptional regulator [Muribaculaceae bacterium]